MSWFRRRPSSEQHASHQPVSGKQATNAAQPFDDGAATDPDARLVQLEAHIHGIVPPVVESRVGRVATTVRAILPRLDQLGLGSSQAFAVVQTATSYLPEALNGYMRLPRKFADNRAVSEGKTSLMVLCDQLDLLGNKMDEVFDAVCRSDADALIAHGRFLNEKFGHGSLSSIPQLNDQNPNDQSPSGQSPSGQSPSGLNAGGQNVGGQNVGGQP